MKRIFTIFSPYIGTGKNQHDIGAFPVEADCDYHYTKSFEELGYVVNKARWRIENENMYLDVPETLNAIKKEIKEFNEITILFECNFKISENKELRQLYNAIKFLRNKGLSIRLIAQVPDSWARLDLLQILGELDFVDRIIVFNESIIQVLRENGLPENIANKCYYTPSLPVVYRGHTAEKNIDFCYIGSPKGQRLQRIGDMMLHRNIHWLVFTNGRDAVEFNPFRSTESYMHAYQHSKFSIITSVMSMRHFKHTHNRLIRVPGQLPGRFAESLSVNCIPVYFQEDTFDNPPSEYTESKLEKPFIVVPPFMRGQEIIELIFKRQITVGHIKDFYDAHLAPEVIISRMLK